MSGPGLWDWIEERIGLPAGDLAPLRGLRLGDLKFFEALDDVREVIRPTTPVHVLPVGMDDFRVVGLHLRPADVEGGSVRLVRWTWTQREALVDLGRPSDAVAITLCELERNALDAGEAGTESALFDRANEAFASETFSRERIRKALDREPGQPGADPIWTGHLAEQIRFELGLSPEAFEEKLAVFDAARAALPDLMSLHAGAARGAFLGPMDLARSASAMADALSCWHHTAGGDVERIFSLAKLLLEKVPAAFDEAAASEVESYGDPVASADGIRRLGRERDGAGLVKTMNDLGHQSQSYVGAVRDLGDVYRHLEWDWALALLELR